MSKLGRTPQNRAYICIRRKDSGVATLARHSGAGYANGTTNSREGEKDARSSAAYRARCRSWGGRGGDTAIEEEEEEEEEEGQNVAEKRENLART